MDTSFPAILRDLKPGDTLRLTNYPELGEIVEVVLSGKIAKGESKISVEEVDERTACHRWTGTRSALEAKYREWRKTYTGQVVVDAHTDGYIHSNPINTVFKVTGPILEACGITDKAQDFLSAKDFPEDLEPSGDDVYSLQRLAFILSLSSSVDDLAEPADPLEGFKAAVGTLRALVEELDSALREEEDEEDDGDPEDEEDDDEEDFEDDDDEDEEEEFEESDEEEEDGEEEGEKKVNGVVVSVVLE